MRKFIMGFSILLCVAGLTACGGQEKDQSGESPGLNGPGEITAATFVDADETQPFESGDTEDDNTAIESTGFHIQETIKLKPNFALYINKDYKAFFGLRLKKVEREGVQFDENLEKVFLEPGEIRKDMVLHSGNATMLVAAINPYENKAPLADCVVCKISSEDTSGVITMDSNYDACGKATYEDMTFGDVYQKTEDQLVYKIWTLIPVDIDVSFEPDSKGDKILEPSGDTDLILDFENGVMKRFSFVLSDAYYSGMEDNIEEDTLETIDQSALEAAEKTRNDILTELKAAFEAAKLDVDINDTTGEIIMGNDILFEKDSYDISDDGKDYLDQFMKAYASVVFGKKYSDSIKEIRFEGHTDSSGEVDYNKKLSQNRADAIKNYCLKSKKNQMTDDQKKQLKKVATSIGYASADLVRDESGKEDPDKSRRVAIKFFVAVE